MIKVVIHVDLDDATRIGSDRRLEAQVPSGYVVSDLRCVGWSRNKAGAVELDIHFLVAETTMPSKR